MSAQRFHEAAPSIAATVPAHRILAHILMLNPHIHDAQLRGFDYIGGGYYSDAFRHYKAPGVVFKLNRSIRNAEAYQVSDTGYTRRYVLDSYALYVSWVQEYTRLHGRQSFLPVIHMAVVRPDRQVYVVEELESIPYVERFAKHRSYVSQILDYGCVDDMEYDEDDEPVLPYDLEDFAMWLRQRIEDYGVAGDLHEGNVMYRHTDDGWEMVLTDPVAGEPRQEEGTFRYREKRELSQQYSFARN